MPPGQSSDVTYRSPEDVFEAFKASPLLKDVRHYWGKIEDKTMATGTRAIWQVRNFGQAPPVQQHDVTIVEPGPDGANRTYRAIHVTDAAVSIQIELFTEVNGPLSPWKLFALYTLAAKQVLKIERKYSFVSSVDPREGVSTATDRQLATLNFCIPIHELQPVAVASADSVAFRTP